MRADWRREIGPWTCSACGTRKDLSEAHDCGPRVVESARWVVIQCTSDTPDPRWAHLGETVARSESDAIRQFRRGVNALGCAAFRPKVLTNSGLDPRDRV